MKVRDRLLALHAELREDPGAAVDESCRFDCRRPRGSLPAASVEAKGSAS